MIRSMLIETGNAASTRLSAEISVEQKAEVARQAARKGMSEQLMLREAISSYCEAQSKTPFDGKMAVDVDKAERCNISVRLPEPLASAFEAKCRRQRVSKSAVIRWIVSEIVSGG